MVLDLRVDRAHLLAVVEVAHEHEALHLREYDHAKRLRRLRQLAVASATHSFLCVENLGTGATNGGVANTPVSVVSWYPASENVRGLCTWL